MTQPSIVQQFRSMVVDLENNPLIKVMKSEFNPPATEKELNATQSYFKLTAAMIDFYSAANGITIQWERKKQKKIADGGLAVGYINLLSIQEVFKNWDNIIYFDKNDAYKSLHPLDFFIDEACAALYLDGSDNPQVYYHYLGEEMSPLGVDFEGYLKLLLKSRGFWYWHKAIVQPEYVNPYVPMSVEETNFREIMPQLFPDFDASDFQRLNNE
ncbi:hypothetical protein NIES4071_85870 [Calothrix sp. NIES-4071]|nr:hypothetical protein NIES4071_85870 [Calothrix sp. NIES-4071]BAZ62854.1 hypothetical protein NIES4105_85800 [Calothrix sp. NIES-4105]